MPSLAMRILPILPRLRRYARMLLSSTIAADETVRICLSNILNDPFCEEPTDDETIFLFQQFTQALKENKDTLDRADAAPFPGNELLTNLTFNQRQVFLLLYVENFTRKQTATILQLKKKKVRKFEAKAAKKLR